ncbi:hypothetical protein KPL71_023747 [Citrus sinensis]|uniref:Uncharacterized protein n=1 Tax=Citrus sinensis TaxID=2711 RepID=A0ACB8IL04_CITSI|nr:hypothetical protein KPL71_023747 [Citrus sinensis]
MLSPIKQYDPSKLFGMTHTLFRDNPLPPPPTPKPKPRPQPRPAPLHPSSLTIPGQPSPSSTPTSPLAPLSVPTQSKDKEPMHQFTAHTVTHSSTTADQTSDSNLAVSDSPTETDTESSASTSDSKKSYADITKILMVQPDPPTQGQTSHTEPYVDIPSEFEDEMHESSATNHPPPTQTNPSSQKSSNGPWFTFDDLPSHKWRDRLTKMSAWIDLQMLRPGATTQSVLREFATRFTGALRDWFDSLGQYRQLQFVDLLEVSSALAVLHDQFLGDPSAVFEAARRDYLNMKCCSLNVKDLDFHYKRMSLLFYKLNGFNEPTLKHVFLASLPDELQPDIQRQLTASNLSLDNISLGKIFQLAKTCLDKLCEQKQFFKELLKDKEPFRSACKKPYLQIKCHKKKDCDCSSKKKGIFGNSNLQNFHPNLADPESPTGSSERNLPPPENSNESNQADVSSAREKATMPKIVPTKEKNPSDEPNDETVFALQNSSDSDSDQSQVIFHQQLLSLDTTVPIPSIKLQILPSKFQRPIPAIGLIDTGAQRNMLNPHILPSEYWTQSEEHFKAVNGKLFTTFLITKKPIGIQIFPNCVIWTKVIGSTLPNKDILLGFDILHQIKHLQIIPTGIRVKSMFKPFTDILKLYNLSETPQSYQDISTKLLSFCPESHSEFTHPNPLWKNKSFFIKLPFKLNEDINPTKATHPGMSPSDLLLAQQECSQLLAQGLIEPTSSQWACQAFYVEKHSEIVRGKKRLVIDYQPLNMFLQDDKFPLPRRQSMFTFLKNAQIFSKFDLKSGFWQLGIEPSERYKTAFCSHDEHRQLLTQFYDILQSHGIMLSAKKSTIATNNINSLTQVMNHGVPSSSKNSMTRDTLSLTLVDIFLTQKHYHSVFKEILAVKNGIKKFEYHLFGHHFLIRMDSSAFPNILNFKGKTVPEKMLLRLKDWFSKYDFSVKHIKGSQNLIPDMLSRLSKPENPLILFSTTYHFPIISMATSLPPKALTKKTFPFNKNFSSVFAIQEFARKALFRFFMKAYLITNPFPLSTFHPENLFLTGLTLDPSKETTEDVLWYVWCLTVLYATKLILPISPTLEHLLNPDNATSLTWTLLEWFSPIPWWRKKLQQLSEIHNLDRMPAPEAQLFTSVFIIHRPYFQHPDTKLFWTQDQVYEWFTAPHIAVIENDIQDVLHNYLCQLNHQPPPLKDISHTSLGPQHDLLMIPTPSAISKPKSIGIIIKEERPDYTDFLYQDSQDPWEDFLPLSQHLHQFPQPTMDEPGPSEPGSSSQASKADKPTQMPSPKSQPSPSKPGYRRDCPYPSCRGPNFENISLRIEQIETKVDSITAQMQQIHQNLHSRIGQLDSELRAMLAHRYNGPEFDQKEREIRRLKAKLAQIESEKQRPTLFTTSPPIPSIGPTYHPFASMISPIKQYDPSKLFGYTHLHLGGIRLILTLHGRKGLPVTARIAMLDTRFKQYQDAVIGTVLTTLHAGNVLLTFYPNFNLSLQDPNLPITLKVQVQIQGAEQISSAKIATLHHQLVYRLQNHALDLPTPEHHSDTLMVLAESDQIPTIIQIPRQIPRHELIKLMPLEWISNYEQFHNNTTPIQTSESMFERRQDGTVRMTFKPPLSAPQEPPRLSFTYSSMITAVQTAQEDLPITGFNSQGYHVYPAKHNGHFLWDAPGSGMCDPNCPCWDDWEEDDDYATTRKKKPKKKKPPIPCHHCDPKPPSDPPPPPAPLPIYRKELKWITKHCKSEIPSPLSHPTPIVQPLASVSDSPTETDTESSASTSDSEKSYADITKILMVQPDPPTQGQTSHTEPYVDIPSEFEDEMHESSATNHPPPTQTNPSSQKSSNGPWFTFDDLPSHKWRDRLTKMSAWIDLQMLRPGATTQSVLREFATRFTGALRDWFDSLGQYRQLQFVDLPEVSSALAVLHDQFLGDPSAVFEAARRDYLNMKCCSLNAKDLDFHYKRMSLLFYKLNGFNEPTLKHVFMASLPEELQPDIQRQLTSSNLSLDSISLGKIFQLAKTCLDKLCEQKQFFKELLKDKEPFRSACKKPYLQIKCHKKKDCDCSSKKKRHFRKFKSPEFSSKPRRSRKPYRFFRKKSSSSREFKRKQSSRCFICKRKGHYAKDCPNNREKSIRLVEHLQATTDYSPAKDELEFYFSEQDEPNDETVFALQNSSDSDSDQSQVIFHQQLLSLDTTVPIPSIKLQILPSKFQRPIPAIGLIDTGAQRSMLNPHILPSEYWTQSE